MSHGTWHALRRAIRVLGKSARVDAQKHGFVFHPYRGYGSSEQIFVMGRVLRQSGRRQTRRVDDNSWGGDLLAAMRHLTRRGAGGMRIGARFYDNALGTTTDRDGYFRVQMAPGSAPATDRIWHTLELELLEPGVDLKSQAQVFIPPDSARFVVISDIDDTVMYTGVANKLMMLWRLFAQGASSRVAFPGVAAFYRALHQGVSGNEINPMLYVSRGPWSLYEMLDAFFNSHGIPIGPLLFLREWGLTLQRPLPRQAKEHKLELIRGMLALYKHLPFVLIGDSGQHDPEIYARVISEHPGRVQAIYIRNISHTARRTQEIEALAEQVKAAGSTLLLASDTFSMAEHAAAHNLISAAAVGRVAEERQAQGEIQRQSPRVPHRSADQDPPPNVEVKSPAGRRQKKQSRGK